jgi:LuxR family maltose regulon positive regulatory protein
MTRHTQSPREGSVLRNPSLAKLTRPRLYDALSRERLFVLLDQGRERPVVWIEAPPGAGKTTLVGSYLESRGLPGIWYQADAGDADPATLFYYLGLAAPNIGGKRKLLPLLTPEQLSELAGFSRRFFRELFGRLPRPGALVVDNYQEVPMGSSFHRILREAVEEAPQGANIIVLSRTEPPPEFARCLASGRVAQLGWEQLRLTLEETRGISRLKHPVADSEIAEIFQRSEGWAAGVILMMEQLRRGGTRRVAPQETREAVFNFFAQEIFDQMTLENQHILLVTAFLPQVSPRIAEKLTGNASAPRLLEYLYHRHLFTDRRGGPEGAYQYHALFREFLSNRARQTYTVRGLADLAVRAAALLEQAGEFDAAVQLFLQARDWDQAASLMLRQAARLLGHGRGQTLREWLAALPADSRRVTPWLDYWHGTSLIQVDQRTARAQLEAVYERFHAENNRDGEMLAVAGIIETYYFEYLDFSPLDRWIPILEEVLTSTPRLLSLETELRAYSSLLAGIWYRQPNRPSAYACAKRVEELLRADVDLNQKVIAAAFLLVFHYAALDFDAVEALAREIEPLLADSRVTPFNKLVWLWRRGWVLYQQARYNEATAAIEGARSLGEEQGLKHTVPYLCYFQLPVPLARGDWKSAHALVDELCMRVNEVRPIDRAFRASARALLALCHGDTGAAVQLSRESVVRGEGIGMPHLQTLFHIVFAYALIGSGQREEAALCTKEIRALVDGACWQRHYGCELQLLEAYAALSGGDATRCRAILREMLPLSRHIGYTYNFRFVPNVLSRIFAEALEAGIEVDYVRGLIRKYAPAPISEVQELWPWPVKVYTLGSFAVLRDDVPLQLTGKPHVKPLDLLKALIATGGREASATHLAELLWPDAEGDSGFRAFETTLHRLRKLLSHDAALKLDDGKLSLDPLVCWVDAWAFEREISDGDRLPDAPRSGAALRRVTALYRGHFLAYEPPRSWMLPYRERLRTKLARHVRHLGEHRQAERRWGEAAAIYERAIELDSLAEEFYRQLMRCQRELGESAEALNTYRRCRDMLSIVLGVQPCAETQALYRSLREG